MPADALTYALCAKELNSILNGGRISKITMPHHDTILLNIRKAGSNHLLLISANPSLPRLHLTTIAPKNPQIAPSFLMHLRKHIGSGSIEGVYQTPNERIITIKINSLNELMMQEQKSLIVEIMGKHSNIILVGERGIISDSIKHISMDISSKRQVMSGLPYSPPPSQENKITILQTELLKDKLKAFEGGNVEKYLASALSGLAISTIREVLFRALGKSTSSSQLTEHEIDAIINEFSILSDYSSAKPCVLRTSEKCLDFFVVPYHSVANDNSLKDVSSTLTNTSSFVYYNTLNEAMDAYYISLSDDQVNSGRRNLLLSVIKAAIGKSERKLGVHMQKQHDAKDFEDDRKNGDLILSNLHKIRKGDSEIEVEDYYNNNTPIRIKINQHKTPQANAQIFYKSYNKKKIALSKLEEFIYELNEKIEYLESLAYFSESLDSEEQYYEILDELNKMGYIKRKLEPNKDKVKSSPFLSTEFNGYRILIGKSSLGNDTLVRKANEESIWLHASSFHGSHVIIENNSKTLPPIEIITRAAEIAAYHSKARQSENVPVDYTFVKNVKKPRNAPLGKVIFSAHKTIYVSPKKELSIKE